MTTAEAKAAPVSANGNAQTDGDAWERLRREFAANEISKRPQPTVKAEEYRQLPKSKCLICGGYHPAEKTIHLDYIGHARVTKRLNEVDPAWEWTWGADDPETGRPSKHLSLTTDQDGSVSLWMAMTVLGVTKREVGYAPPKAEQFKDAVSDAISRCAMRFGVGLDLWIKEPAETLDVTARIPAANVPSSHPCGSPGCTGTLVQRTGSRGDFVSCTGYAQCGFKPVDGRLDDFLAAEREFADSHDVPADPPAPTNEPPSSNLSDVDYIRQCWQRVTSDVRLEAFSTGDLARLLSFNSKKVWVLRPEGVRALKVAPEDRVRAVRDYFVSYFQEMAAA